MVCYSLQKTFELNLIEFLISFLNCFTLWSAIKFRKLLFHHFYIVPHFYWTIEIDLKYCINVFTLYQTNKNPWEYWFSNIRECFIFNNNLWTIAITSIIESLLEPMSSTATPSFSISSESVVLLVFLAFRYFFKHFFISGAIQTQSLIEVRNSIFYSLVVLVKLRFCRLFSSRFSSYWCIFRWSGDL